MDAYDVQQRVKALWETIARPTSGDALNKVFPETPVYVLVEGKLISVTEVYLDDRKIILRAE
jgi:hypothetical protein